MVQHAVVAGRQRVGRVWSTVRLQYAAPGTQPPQMIARLHHYVAVRQTLDDGANLVNGLKCNTCVHHNTRIPVCVRGLKKSGFKLRSGWVLCILKTLRLCQGHHTGDSWLETEWVSVCVSKNDPTLKRYSSKLQGSILMTFGRKIRKSVEQSLHVAVFM